MKKIIVDIESRSACDLRKCGVYAYAEHPSTSITHVGYRLHDGPIVVWRPSKGSMPSDLLAALTDPTVTCVAHNVSFERTMLTGAPGRAIGMPVSALQDLSRWSCTAVRAAQVQLSRDLAKVGVALNLPSRKDPAGHALMLKVCKPKRDGTWHEDEGSMEAMSRYCARDVEAEYLLDQALPALSPSERAIWEATEAANDRRVRVDQDLLSQMAGIAEEARVGINARISELTGKVVPKVSNHGKLALWLNANGVKTRSTDKHAILDLLEQADEANLVEDEDLHGAIVEVLELRRDGGGSSISKIPAIARHLSKDGRLRGALARISQLAPIRKNFASGGRSERRG